MFSCNLANMWYNCTYSFNLTLIWQSQLLEMQAPRFGRGSARPFHYPARISEPTSSPPGAEQLQVIGAGRPWLSFLAG